MVITLMINDFSFGVKGWYSLSGRTILPFDRNVFCTWLRCVLNYFWLIYSSEEDFYVEEGPDKYLFYLVNYRQNIFAMW